MLRDFGQQVAALVQLHDKEESPFILVGCNEAYQMRVLQFARLLQLSLKDFRIRVLHVHALDGAGLSVLLGNGLEDLPEATLPQQILKVIGVIDAAFRRDDGALAPRPKVETQLHQQLPGLSLWLFWCGQCASGVHGTDAPPMSAHALALQAGGVAGVAGQGAKHAGRLSDLLLHRLSHLRGFVAQPVGFQLRSMQLTMHLVTARNYGIGLHWNLPAIAARPHGRVPSARP
mmetsp:Transcript_104704/g.249310  ORF Transcript_104704/g.249310 Transcript_104704/m.249310 type:complete len:231 (+) Transcript_104704:635-1327(+)